ncbi:DUF3265 domain-containing protein [Vibrio vulnificus]|nr:DUF3265 domain-containing protein [Vibrio vulnificus]POC44626.1 hypothetical protein CRN45_21190 [Vibrio vulnificus]POC58596.1 hypothetical protein CRN44_20815 [Vibrio vulnificus]
MTRRLRGIWHAWHFRFALSSVIKSLCGSFCIACLHPLTRRYAFSRKIWQFLIKYINMNQCRYSL